MTIELSEFYQTFFDEASEHLAEMESLLLGLNIDAPDFDELNAVFRAAHSIKGGSGMFGFNEMVEVTHILETLLDRIRKGELRINEAMVDAFLQAADIIKGQIAARQGGDSIEQSQVDCICNTLQQLSDDGPAIASAVPSPSESAASPAAAFLEIRVLREGSPLAEPAPCDWLVDNLGGLGQLEVVDPGEEPGKPAFLKLSQSASVDAIKEVFAAFVRPEQVEISHTAPAVPVSTPDEEAGYGFFTTPEEAKSAAEKAQLENEQGFGFFTGTVSEPTAAKSAVEKSVQEGTKAGSVELFEKDTKPPHQRGPKTEDRPIQKGASAANADTSIRVNIDKVDQLINLVGELVITQAMLAQTASEVDPMLHEKLHNGIGLLERSTRDLQEAVMSIRMMPMSFVFSRFPRMVRDIAGKLKKEVNFKTQGEATELDKGVIEKITDPLTHLVRNSLDHGIEAPDVRVQKGKDPKGNLILRAFHQGGNVVIEVQDDGAGLNREKILAKARERGLPVSDGMAEQEVWQLILAPGFSTADVVTDVSGRGVGMDVVKKNIESLSGRIEIESYQGLGTKMTIRLPLTLAILDGLSLRVGAETFIIPLTAIIESIQPKAEDVKTVAGQGEVVQVRGEYLPLTALYRVFNIRSRIRRPQEGTLMIVEADGVKAALLVDELLGQHQVVIKSLETNYRKVPGISGATIMGDGRVALILDVTGLVRMSKEQGGAVFSNWQDDEEDTQEASTTVNNCRQPEDDRKEDEQATLDKAIQAHSRWKMRLMDILGGHGEKLNCSEVAKDNVCDLGKWIYGRGEKYAKLPTYRQLKDLHAKFHRCAADVVRKHEAGDAKAASTMMASGGSFDEASKATIGLLMKLKAELDSVTNFTKRSSDESVSNVGYSNRRYASQT